MHTYEKRSNENNRVLRVNIPMQKRELSNSTLKFVDKRPNSVAQRALLKATNTSSSVVQLGGGISSLVDSGHAPISPLVYYGHGSARQPFLDNDANTTTMHTTVDSLNIAIGLTPGRMGGLMSDKRNTVNNALSTSISWIDSNLSFDEFFWIAWLRENKEALLMPEMNGEQCRVDMKMDPTQWSEDGKALHSPKNHDIIGYNKTWTQEDHTVNVNKNRQQQDFGWNPQRRQAHDNYVEGKIKDEGVLLEGMKAVFDSQIAENIAGQTYDWLWTSVMDRFWRLTSLMGLDFFVSMGKYIAFIREDGQAIHLNQGRKSITDSEWEHVKKMNYNRGQNPHVKRFISPK